MLLICISFMTNVLGCPFICLFASVPLCGEVYSNLPLIFGGIVFLLLSYESPLFVLDTNLLSICD